LSLSTCAPARSTAAAPAWTPARAAPPDFAEALNDDPEARAAFDRLAYGLKRKHVLAIEGAKTLETRQRRIAKVITTIRGDRA
jgi:uncharacterized protein YdeI (YjbR/CyaY-like superfamily)